MTGSESFKDNKMNKILVGFFVVLIGYLAACASANALLRIDTVFATPQQTLAFLVTATLAAGVIYAVSHAIQGRKLYRTITDPRQVKNLQDYMLSGVVAGSYAYTREEVEYCGGTLVAMSEVYVIAVEGTQAMVFPVDQFEKSYAVFMDTTALIKHVPQRMVPRMLPA